MTQKVARKKVAVQIIATYIPGYVEPVVRNCYPHVDKIYLLHSNEPYSALDRELGTNKPDVTIDKLKSLRDDNNKIEILEFDVSREDQARNIALKAARKGGYDLMIIQDVDEFYPPETYSSLIRQCISSPEVDYYRNPWYVFWKDYKHVIEFDHGKSENSTTNSGACFAINLNKAKVEFEENRLPNTREYKMLEGHCYHFSYVYNDDQVRRKIESWGHSTHVKFKKFWYKYKWLAWREATKYLNPIGYCSWARAVRFVTNYNLEELFHLPAPPEPSNVKVNRVYERTMDLVFLIVFELKKLKSQLTS